MWQKLKKNHAAFGAYSYEYGYDSVENRTSLSIEAVDWTYESNTLNQLKKRA